MCVVVFAHERIEEERVVVVFKICFNCHSLSIKPCVLPDRYRSLVVL